MLKYREFVHTLVWVKRHLLHQLPVPEADLLAPHINRSDVLFDVGAHAGAWTVALSRLVPEGRVYAFEALPYYSRVLRATLWALRKTNVHVIGKAVLDERKPVQIVWRSPAGVRLTGLTHLQGRGESAEDTLTVEGLQLDEFISRISGKVRFIKMDIEGAELLAIRGAERMLTTFRPLLYIELNDEYCHRYGHSTADVFDLLSQHNYRAYQRRADASWSQVESTSYSGAGNVWCVPIEDAQAFLGGSDLPTAD